MKGIERTAIVYALLTSANKGNKKLHLIVSHI